MTGIGRELNAAAARWWRHYCRVHERRLVDLSRSLESGPATQSYRRCGRL